MLGHRKNKWTAEEKEALLAGIAKYGAGNWKMIVKDPEFAVQLLNRTNGDLKDKWRNMERYASISPANTTSPSPNSSSDLSCNESRFDAIVMEAISTINDDEYGSDLTVILSFFKERYEVPQNFSKLLSDGLRILVSQGKLEKVGNGYKMSSSSEVGNKVESEEVARKLGESDNKRFIAEEAVKEAELMVKLAKESRMILQLGLEIHQQCALGKKVLLR